MLENNFFSCNIHLNKGVRQMQLEKYFEGKPRGTKVAMARALGISKVWLSILIAGTHKASPELCVRIEKYTDGAVSRFNLRPDIFGRLK